MLCLALTAECVVLRIEAPGLNDASLKGVQEISYQ